MKLRHSGEGKIFPRNDAAAMDVIFSGRQERAVDSLHPSYERQGQWNCKSSAVCQGSRFLEDATERYSFESFSYRALFQSHRYSKMLSCESGLEIQRFPAASIFVDTG